MKHLCHYLIFLIFSAVIISSCKKDFPKTTNKENDFIIAGEINQNNFIDFNDSISWEWGQEVEIPIDINNDNINDFEFKVIHGAYQGGTLNMFFSKLEIFNHIEILADTSLMSNEVRSKKELTPKILDLNVTINSDGVWITDTICNLCYSIDDMVYTDNVHFSIEKSIFDGWNNLENKFLGYRYFSDNDTIYGWLEFEVNDFNKVYVYQTSHN